MLQIICFPDFFLKKQNICVPTLPKIFKPVSRYTLIILFCLKVTENYTIGIAGPRSAVGNVSGYRCVSDCRSRGREFDPGPVPYFRGD